MGEWGKWSSRRYIWCYECAAHTSIMSGSRKCLPASEPFGPPTAVGRIVSRCCIIYHRIPVGSLVFERSIPLSITVYVLFEKAESDGEPQGECSLGRLKSALRTTTTERWPIRKLGNQTPITCPLLVVQVRWAFDLVVLEKTSVDPKRCHDLAWCIASNPFKWISSAEMPHFDDDGEHELGL